MHAAHRLAIAITLLIGVSLLEGCSRRTLPVPAEEAKLPAPTEAPAKATGAAAAPEIRIWKPSQLLGTQGDNRFRGRPDPENIPQFAAMDKSLLRLTGTIQEMTVNVMSDDGQFLPKIVLEDERGYGYGVEATDVRIYMADRMALRDLRVNQSVVIEARFHLFYGFLQFDEGRVVSRGPLPDVSPPPEEFLSEDEARARHKRIKNAQDARWRYDGVSLSRWPSRNYLELFETVTEPDGQLPLDLLDHLHLVGEIGVVFVHGKLSAEGARQLDTLPAIEDVAFESPSVGDDALREIARLPRLQSVEIANGESLTEEGFAALEKVPTLRVLQVEGATTVGDEGLRHLAGLSQLRWLNLSHMPITDEGLAVAAQLPELRRFGLHFCEGVKGHGLAHLARCPKLYGLMIDFAPINLEGVASLGRLSSLEELYLSGKAVGDPLIAGLIAVPRLRELDLRYTSITETGLQHAAKIKTLRELRLLGNGELQGSDLAKKPRPDIEVIIPEGPRKPPRTVLGPSPE